MGIQQQHHYAHGLVTGGQHSPLAAKTFPVQFCVESARTSVFPWVHSICSSFLLQSKYTHLRLIGVNVRVYGYFSLQGSLVMDWQLVLPSLIWCYNSLHDPQDPAWDKQDVGHRWILNWSFKLQKQSASNNITFKQIVTSLQLIYPNHGNTYSVNKKMIDNIHHLF